MYILVSFLKAYLYYRNGNRVDMIRNLVFFILFFNVAKLKVRSYSHFGGRDKPKIWTVIDCDVTIRTQKECSGEEFKDCLNGRDTSSEDDGIMNTLKCTKSSECKDIPESKKWGPCIEAEDGGGEGGGCLACEKGSGVTVDGKGCKKDLECCQRCVKISVRTDKSSSSRICNEDWSSKLALSVYLTVGFLA